jgi:hypothetical protein
MFQRKGAMKNTNSFQTAVPPTPAEAAAAAAQWERRGILGRLVRLDDAVATSEERRPAALRRSQRRLGALSGNSQESLSR